MRKIEQLRALQRARDIALNQESVAVLLWETAAYNTAKEAAFDALLAVAEAACNRYETYTLGEMKTGRTTRNEWRALKQALDALDEVEL